ncbi:hypothetical protein MesoLjLc_51710 [Mesorhizobium sp. L-8-10]|uniref:ProQ/FinO family protein n=1 Tax=Mesorhizobium sp. L-8-10 TaxID=2744523 RepID=UPI0019275249|nr:ProQ/FinO family protein [Mesorhizobium sp. L-8-10]BCH33241.1 hypothetical protein MesoLjLc_51710 [Mesorhizobium sp. L-8-10]
MPKKTTFAEREKIQAMRIVLSRRFPAAFMAKGHPTKLPLKVGIRDDVFAAAPDLNKEFVRRAIGDYCTGPKYARAMKAGVVRVDLNGSAAGTVTEKDEHYNDWREERRKERSRQYQRDRASLTQIKAQVVEEITRSTKSTDRNLEKLKADLDEARSAYELTRFTDSTARMIKEQEELRPIIADLEKRIAELEGPQNV